MRDLVRLKLRLNSSSAVARRSVPREQASHDDITEAQPLDLPPVATRVSHEGEVRKLAPVALLIWRWSTRHDERGCGLRCRAKRDSPVAVEVPGPDMKRRYARRTPA